MELIEYKNILVSYFFQGFTRNGNAMYVINFFKKLDSGRFLNMNYEMSQVLSLKLDKNQNIKHIKNVGVAEDIKQIIDDFLREY